MYNIYTYEKRLKDKQSLAQLDTENKVNNDRYKLFQNNNIENSKDRIRNFLYKLAESPIVLNDHYTYDYDLNKKEQRRQRNKKVFSYNLFETDKERLQSQLNQQKEDEKYDKLRDEIELKRRYRQNSDLDNKTSILVQPIMRFQPRNDIERICDSLKLQAYSPLLSKKITDKMNSILPKSKKQYSRNDDRYYSLGNKNRKKFRETNALFNNVQKNKINFSNALVDLTSENYTKTFFNSAKEYSLLHSEDFLNRLGGSIENSNKEGEKKDSTTNIMFNTAQNSMKNSPKNANIANLASKNILGKSTSLKNFKNNSRNINNNYKFPSFNRLERHYEKQINEEMHNDNLLLSENFLPKFPTEKRMVMSLQSNPYISEKKLTNDNQFSNEDMEYLKQICSYSRTQSGSKKEKQKNNEKKEVRKNDKDKIFIGNKYYDRKDLEGISKNILVNCHVIRKKFDDLSDNNKITNVVLFGKDKKGGVS